MRPRLLLAGYYGRGNAGDDAILAALHQELVARVPDLQLTVTAGPHALPAGVERVDPRNLPVLSAVVQSSDAVGLGGGGLLQDYWPVRTDALLSQDQGGLVEYLATPVLAHLHGVPTVLCALGAGPLRTAEGREQAGLAVQLAQAGTLRDVASYEVLAGAAGRPLPKQFRVATDPAFLLEPDEAGVDELLISAGCAPGEALVAVALRHWPAGDPQTTWLEPVLQGLDPVLERRAARLLVLPFERTEGAGSDGDLARRVRQLRPHARVLADSPSPAQLAALLSRCQAVVAMRYHAALLASLGGTPAACLAYDPKVEQLAVQLGGPAALRQDSWIAVEVEAALEQALARPREEVRQHAAAASEAARATIDVLVEALSGPRPPAPAPVAQVVRRLALQRSVQLEQLREQASSAAAESVQGAERLVARDAQLLQAQGELARHQEQFEQLWSQAATRQQELDRLQADVQERERALAEAARREQQVAARLAAAERARDEANRAAAEQQQAVAERLQQAEQEAATARLVRTAAEEDLRLVTSSPAYRMAAPVWRLGNAALPLGSRRRALYHRARRRLDDAVPDSSGVPTAAVPHRPGTLDDLAQLSQFEQQARARGAERVVVVLSGTQLREDEGQRPTQLALQMAAQGVPVVFAYFRWDHVERHTEERRADGIHQVPLDVLLDQPAAVAGMFAGLNRMLLVAFPYPRFFELLARCNAAGWCSVYDVLDDWEQFHAVGQAIWWDREFEQHLVRSASVVTAINQPLAELVSSQVEREVQVVPNGLRPGLERVQEARPLERGEVTVGYFGHLTTAWFDWELLAEAANRTPTWRWYVIGYGGGPEKPLPDNVVLLGRQPQPSLAAFAQNWDVGIVPFRRTRLAECADPIKVYEYLAMGLPVVVSGVHAPPGADAFVERVDDVEQLLDALGRAAAQGADARGARREYAARCTWGSRTEALLGLVAGSRS